MQNEAAYTNHFCPACHSENHDEYTVINSLTVQKCGECGLAFVKQVPSDEQLTAHYTKSYVTSENEFVPKTSLTRRLKYWAFSKWIQVLCRKSAPIKTLEIGCNEGTFLDIVKNNPRFEASGIDICEKPLKYAHDQGFNVTLSDLESMNYPDQSFDFVFAIHVMEHVQNPERMLAEIQRILKPGGYYFAVMPCISHIKARLAGLKWHYLGPPAHLWYFTPNSLSRFVTRLGFKSVHSSTFYHRAHVRVLARKDEVIPVENIPRWMGTFAGSGDTQVANRAA